MYTSGFVSPWHIVLAHKQAMLEKILDDLHIVILKVTLKCLGNLLVQSIGIYIFEVQFQMQNKCLHFYFLPNWRNMQGSHHRLVNVLCPFPPLFSLPMVFTYINYRWVHCLYFVIESAGNWYLFMIAFVEINERKCIINDFIHPFL